jgi:hypothetical protein
MIPITLFEYINHFCSHSTVIFVIISKKSAIVFGVFESNLRSARTDHVCHAPCNPGGNHLHVLNEITPTCSTFTFNYMYSMYSI